VFPAKVRRKIIFLLSHDKEFRRKLKTLLRTYPVDTEYYRRAFTHRSAVKRRNGHNERLEYLGDAIMGAIVAEYLYKKYPYHEEGSLTKMRSTLVNRLSLLKIGKDMGLDEFLVSNINEMEGKYLLSNAVEALVGAVYLDLGYRYTRHFVLDILFADMLDEDIETMDCDFKSRMLEWGQKNKQPVSFELAQSGHSTFSSHLLIAGEIAGTGTGCSKKESEQNAAKSVWIQLNSTNN
jgi:ribonuclease-3